jgi:hypothetical protein
MVVAGLAEHHETSCHRHRLASRATWHCKASRDRNLSE